MMIINLNPSIIFFTHSRIRSRFTGCRKMLQETLEELRNNPKLIENIPKIKVVFDNTKKTYFSMNNRRLWVFKRLYNEGMIKEIPVYLESMKKNSKMRHNQYSLVAKIDKD